MILASGSAFRFHTSHGVASRVPAGNVPYLFTFLERRMVSMKKIGLYAGIVGALASVAALVLPGTAVSQSSSGANSPVISGNGNTVNYQSHTGFPGAETIRAQRPNISERQYQAIQPGMTYDEVLDIVKIPGKEAASTGRVQVYTWGTEVYVYMTVTLVDGKVQSKSH